METGIYKAITNAMKEISPIAKEKRNKEQGFQYRGVDDVMNELNPILSKHNIFIYPEVVGSERHEREARSGSKLLYSILTIKYHFATDDGSEICTTVIGEGMDSGDKASNKAMAVAFKYACLQMFCIPTDDMDDPDKHTPPDSTPAGQNNHSKNTQNGKQNTPQNNEPNDQQSLLSAIKTILFTVNPDHYPYFTDSEKEKEKAIASGAANLQVLKNQYTRLKNDLAKREAANKPIPFGETAPNTTGAIKNGTATTNDEFKDDIPWDENKGNTAKSGEIEIF